MRIQRGCHMWHSSAHPAACFTWAGWKKVSQRGQHLYQVMLRCVKVMSLAELTRLKEQVLFLEGRVWEEVKFPECEFAALHYNSEQEAENALARTSTQARVVAEWVATARLFSKSPPFPLLSQCAAVISEWQLWLERWRYILTGKVRHHILRERERKNKPTDHKPHASSFCTAVRLNFKR